MVTTAVQAMWFIGVAILAMFFTFIFVKVWDTIEQSKGLKKAKAKLGWFLLKHFYPAEYTKLKAEKGGKQ